MLVGGRNSSQGMEVRFSVVVAVGVGDSLDYLVGDLDGVVLELSHDTVLHYLLSLEGRNFDRDILSVGLWHLDLASDIDLVGTFDSVVLGDGRWDLDRLLIFLNVRAKDFPCLCNKLGGKVGLCRLLDGGHVDRDIFGDRYRGELMLSDFERLRLDVGLGSLYDCSGSLEVDSLSWSARASGLAASAADLANAATGCLVATAV